MLLHGLGSSGTDWELQAPVFSQHYPVLTVDLRGHGRSPPPDGAAGFTIAQMADDVAALLDHLQAAGTAPAGGAYLLGLSLGGCVALALAARRPDLARALVLVNTFARLRPAGLRGLGRLLRRGWLLATAPMPVLAAYVARGLFPRPDQQDYYEQAAARLGRNPKRAYLAAMRALAGLDLRPLLPQVRCPTLVVTGDRDTTVPRVAAKALQRGIAGAQFALVADSGHATPIDQPEVFNALVLEFLEGK
ncbi:MAG: alpha/beta fold hydrolase [Anaerolineales bacterium]|nr:alpha/beta fold hydrolase [Anaerolineales bacterium]